MLVGNRELLGVFFEKPPEGQINGMKRSTIVFVSLVTAGALAVSMLIFASFGYPKVTGGLQAYTGLLVLMGLTAAAEGAAMRFSAGRAGLSPALITIVTTVPLFGPSVAVVATALSEAAGCFLVKKQHPIKSLFNTAQFTLAVGLGSFVFMGLGGRPSPNSFDLMGIMLPMGGLIGAYFLTNTSMVSAVIAVDTGKRFRDIWREVGPVAFVNDLGSSSFSLLLVFAFAELGVPGLLVLILPLLFVHHSYGVYLQLQQQNKEILELLVKTIEAKDPYTSGHSLRVARLSRDLAETLGVSPRLAGEVEIAALLHDIGKIDIAYAELLGSPARLSEAEREIIRSHPERGAKLLASISSLGGTILAAVKHHHEHYDGNGYPDGLAGTEIPLAARIIMVVDTVDAMLSNRPYRAALGDQAVTGELRRFSGRQFDPVIVATFLEKGMVQRAAHRADADRTPLPLVPASLESEVAAS